MPAFVQGAHTNLGTGTGASVTATFGSASTAGNTIVGVVSFGSATTLSNVKDGAGHTFTVLDTFTDGVNGQIAASFYLPNTPGGSTTVVATFGATVGAISISVAEYSGVAAASLDGHIGQLQATPGTGGNAVTSTAITTTASGDIVVGLVAGTAGQASTFTAGTSPNAFTSRATTTDSGSPNVANLQIEDFVQSASGSIAATFTQNAAGATISFVVGLKAAVAAAGIALGRIASDIFVPGRRQGPTRGLRPTQNFAPPPQPPFVFIQDSPRWRSTATAVLLLTNLNTSFVPQPPAPPALGWLQPFATPRQPAPRQYDLNQGWVPQVPSVTPPTPVETDVSQPGPVFTQTALYQAFATQPPTAPAPVVVTPPIGWLAPFAVPPQLLRRFDTNQAWIPQPAPPATLGWLQAFPTAPRLARLYDLNQGWVPQPPPTAATPTPSTLGWLNPFPTQTARRPVYDVNQGWVPQVPSAPVVTPPIAWLMPSSDLIYRQTYLYQSLVTPPPPSAAAVTTPSILGWLQPFDAPPRQVVVANTILAPFALPEIPVLGWFRPFDQPPPKARPRYDSNSGWVPRVPPAAVVTPPSLGWLQSFATPPRDTLVFDTIIEPFALPAPVISASAEVDIAQPGPVYTRTFIYQSLFAPPQAVGGTTPIVVLPLENDSPQPGPIYQRLALYQAFATLPPQPPAAVVAPPPLGWLSSFDQFYRQTYLYQSLVTPLQVPPAITTPSILGWLQPFGIPRQPVRLWDWNTAWPAAPPAPVAITPSTLGWLQPFPIPPQPPRRPTFNEIYVPQNVGGTAPIPPTVLQPGGASVPHTFSRKRWRELQALIAAENAAVAKAERLTKESKREPLLKAARAAAAAIDAADKEGESKRLDALLLRNAESLRKAIRAATDVKRIREAANAIELSNAIVARTIEDEEDEMIQLLLLLS